MYKYPLGAVIDYMNIQMCKCAKNKKKNTDDSSLTFVYLKNIMKTVKFVILFNLEIK